MDLPYYLQKLPPEGHDVLRFLARRGGAASVPEIETGARLSNRMVLRTIRRLVNEGHVEVRGGQYALTGDGRAAAQYLAQLPEPEQGREMTGTGGQATETPDARPDEAAKTAPVAVVRRVAIVMPRHALAGTSATLFFGVNPPEIGAPRLSGSARLELRISAVGGNLSAFKVEVTVPPDRAAAPARVDLVPAQAGRPVRIRVDAAQIEADGSRLLLGGAYFDVHVPPDASTYDPTPAAVGMDVRLVG